LSTGLRIRIFPFIDGVFRAWLSVEMPLVAV